MTDAAVPVLEQILAAIQATNANLVRIESGTNARLDGLGDRLDALCGDVRDLGERVERVEAGIDRLHGDVALTNTTLGVMSERMAFFERVATTTMQSRARLEDRVDRLESRVDAIERG